MSRNAARLFSVIPHVSQAAELSEKKKHSKKCGRGKSGGGERVAEVDAKEDEPPVKVPAIEDSKPGTQEKGRTGRPKRAQEQAVVVIPAYKQAQGKGVGKKPVWASSTEVEMRTPVAKPFQDQWCAAGRCPSRSSSHASNRSILTRSHLPC